MISPRCVETIKNNNSKIRKTFKKIMNIQVKNVRRLFFDGIHHNAFTGMCRFRDKIFLAFRSGATHLTFDGVIVVLSSEDEGRNWRKVANLSIAGADLRDPSLLATADCLYVYAGKRQGQGDNFYSTSVVYVSENGNDFSLHELSGLAPKTFLWSVLNHAGEFVGTGYTTNGKFCSTLYKSTNGIHWHRYLDFSPEANETSIDSDENGVLYGMLRMESSPQHPIPFFLKPDSETPHYGSFPFPMQGIMLRRYSKGVFLVGRRWDVGRKNLRIEMFYLPDGHEPVLLGQLPSGGDCSYASMVSLSNGDSLIAYYSMHAYLDKFQNHADPEHTLPADIYLAVVKITE